MSTTRDAQGIPHVVGDGLLDVAHGQGVAVAEDRAWQLEVERRRGEGTCAEVFGPAALEWDVLARRALLAETARRALVGLGAEARDLLVAYVAGVNEGLGRARVPELTALGLRPGRWEPWTPIAVFAVQHLLFGAVGNKLWRHHVAHVLDAGEPAGADDLLALLRIEGQPGGSNAVALAGQHTASGLPMVAGDPHRVLEAPGCYQQVRLTSRGSGPHDPPFDVVGLTFAGVPGVQHFGHTGDVAWGVTNAVADSEDLYVEQLRRDGDAVLARGPAGWEQLGRRTTTIAVRGHAPTTVEVLVGDRGPVVLGGPEPADGLPAGTAISLRTPPHVSGSWGFDALPALLRARKGADVVAAFAHWVAPVNNLLVADRSGTVEHRVVGRVPVRSRPATGWRLPAGADGHGWTGWVGDLPRRSGGVLVSANDRADDSWARIGTDFAPPYRRDRIGALVAAHARPLGPAELGTILADTRQSPALLDLLLGLLPEVRAGLGPEARVLVDELVDWDRRMDPDSRSAARYAALRDAVVEEIHDALDARWGLGAADGSPYGRVFAPWFELRGRIRGSLTALLRYGAGVGVDVPAVLVAALQRAAADLPDHAWGEAHVAVPLTPHEQFGLPAPPGAPTPVPVGGDEECVQATRALGGTGASVHGPVARYVWDLAGASRWVVPLGAHGDPASSHHHDQQPAWAAGATLPVDTPPTEERP